MAADTDASGNVLRTYAYGPGVDNILAMTVHGASTNTYFYLKDHQNSVIALVDQNGSVVERYSYSAYGETTIFDSIGTELTESAYGNRYFWQGREYDSSTELYFFRARWYSPETGRWLSKDPIGISGGLNMYVFCANNPLNFTDPMGCCGGFVDNLGRQGQSILDFYGAVLFGLQGNGAMALPFFPPITINF